MQTDIPLKRLTALRSADLLPLFDLPADTVLGVHTHELPASATRLDTLLRVRSPEAQEYLLVVEWQGYRDRAVLWRLASYVAWLGQEHPEQPVIGVVVYLHPDTDMGATLRQVIDGQVVQQWQLACVRLWEHTAAALVARNTVGLAVLSPLAADASDTLVEQAIEVVRQQAPLSQQADLLTILGVFAEPLIATERFIRLIGREHLMESQLFNYLMKDKIEELQAAFQLEKAVLEAEKAKLERLHLEARIKVDEAQRAEQELLHSQQQALIEALLTRFQQVSPALVRDIWRVTSPHQLHTLVVGLVQAADLGEFEALLQQVMTQQPDQSPKHP